MPRRDSKPAPVANPAAGWDSAEESDKDRWGSNWDRTVVPTHPPSRARPQPSLRAQVLSLLADPRVESITATTAAKALGRPRQDLETVLQTMEQSGELVSRGGANKAYTAPVGQKQALEAMFRSATIEAGVPDLLAKQGSDETALVALEDEVEEPRLPVTAGLLSLFLPGTGQLLNGDVGRASLVFAVWSLAWITHLSPVWTFVCLYAGAEAFFTAKIRSMERKLAKETAAGPPRALPSKTT